MIELKLNEENSEPCKNFRRRQCHTESTASQSKFDWAFGVILPVVCFVFDPIVFKGGFWDGALLGSYKPFTYILSFILIMAMSAWLIWGEKLKWLNALLAGLFAVGGVVASVIAIVLAPFSLFGLVVIIGILGFTPAFTAIVYLRTALKSFQMARSFLDKKVLVYTFAVSALFSAVVPSVINAEITKSFERMLEGNAQAVRAEAQILRFVAPITNFDALARHYQGFVPEERNTEKLKTIAAVYKEMTSEDLTD